MIKKQMRLHKKVQNNVERIISQVLVSIPVNVFGGGKGSGNDKDGQKSPTGGEQNGHQAQAALAINKERIKTDHHQE